MEYMYKMQVLVSEHYKFFCLGSIAPQFSSKVLLGQQVAGRDSIQFSSICAEKPCYQET
jgi:hypothetical protein